MPARCPVARRRCLPPSLPLSLPLPLPLSLSIPLPPWPAATPTPPPPPPPARRAGLPPPRGGPPMTWDVALILLPDGLANGAFYLLAGLGLVLVFSVTRVVFVPFGDIAAFAALTLAAFETGRLPPTIGLV